MADVQIDYTTVTVMAEQFALASKELMALLQAVDGDIIQLETEAFKGLVGNYLSGYHLDTIRPEFEALATHCQLLSDDLNEAVSAIASGDSSGRARFAR